MPQSSFDTGEAFIGEPIKHKGSPGPPIKMLPSLHLTASRGGWKRRSRDVIDRGRSLAQTWHSTRLMRFLPSCKPSLASPSEHPGDHNPSPRCGPVVVVSLWFHHFIYKLNERNLQSHLFRMNRCLWSRDAGGGLRRVVYLGGRRDKGIGVEIGGLPLLRVFCDRSCRLSPGGFAGPTHQCLSSGEVSRHCFKAHCLVSRDAWHMGPAFTSCQALVT